MPHYSSPESVVSLISSGERVFIQGSAATPTALIKALAARADSLEGIEIVSITLYGEVPLVDEGMERHFRMNSLFVSAPLREAVQDGRADYVPVFLSEIPELFRENILPIDTAIVHVSPPDIHGYCSLGVSVDIARTAVNTAKKVLAQVNPNMPRTAGDGMVHVDRFAAMTWVEDPLHEAVPHAGISEVERKIGTFIAGIIEDGSTLQTGIGSIPDAVLSCLHSHRDLGIHTEMFSDGIIELMEKGIVNNSRKHSHPGKTVTGFCVGSRKLYDFVHDNPAVAFLDIDYVNEVSVIQQNPKVVAINSCIEIDLTGQVCADSIGTYQFSGVGGQMDFMRGAALSKGGKPIIAVPARTSHGKSRIVPFLTEGAGVVTTRAHVHYVVTEFGMVNLFGKNLRQRAEALSSIAHPDDREALEHAVWERFKKR